MALIPKSMAGFRARSAYSALIRLVTSRATAGALMTIPLEAEERPMDWE
jgi:hypothetical protein